MRMEKIVIDFVLAENRQRINRFQCEMEKFNDFHVIPIDWLVLRLRNDQIQLPVCI